jgi:hypothetical protein
MNFLKLEHFSNQNFFSKKTCIFANPNFSKKKLKQKLEKIKNWRRSVTSAGPRGEWTRAKRSSVLGRGGEQKLH